MALAYGFINPMEEPQNICLDTASNEENMCKSYGKHMMGMAVPFLVGIAIDLWKAGLGCLIAWGAWFVLFVLLLIKRDRRERDQ